ncbi:MAG: S8 family peptidase [Parcubacteria group bacterium]|nr:S8 family peptidase [Parcubacteria group bacterium]
MKKTILFILIFSLIFIFSTQFSRAAEKDGGPRYFVKSTSGFWKNALGARHVFEEEGGFTADISDFQVGLARIFGLEIEPVDLLHILPTEVNKKPEVAGKPTTRLTPTDQTPWGIEAVYNNLLLTQTSGGAGINVAVLDTGVLRTHPDLKSRIAQCKDFSTRSSFVEDKCDDKNGHGTHVSGTILADGGSDHLGVYGVAPEAKLFAYKVCGNDGSCWADDIQVALKTAADQGANVVNMSLGADVDSSFIRNGITYAVGKGVLVVAAGGNDGPYASSIDYPGANASVVSVGSVDNLLKVSDWSSRGINSTTTAEIIEEKDMEFAAPGVNVESTWKNGGYMVLSGTSMATPHITGLAAKLWQTPLAGSTSTAATLTRAYLKSLVFDVIEKVTPDAGGITDDVGVGEDNGSGYGFPRLP